MEKAPGVETVTYDKVSKLLTLFLVTMFHSVSPRLWGSDVYTTSPRTRAGLDESFVFNKNVWKEC